MTLRKSLVASKLAVCTSFADATIGMQLDGVVSKVMEKGLLVDLFGGLRALVPITEAADGYVKTLSELFTVGQPTVVRLTAVNAATQQLTARIRQAEQLSIDAVDVGVAYEAVVSALHVATVSVRLEPSGVTGLVTHDRLARARQTTADELKASLKVGDRLGQLVVTSRDEAKSIVMVSPLSLGQPSSISGVNAGTDISFDTLDVGQVVPVAKVVGSMPQGLLVQIGRSLRGRAAWTDVADDYDAPRPDIGEAVRAVIVALDVDHRRIGCLAGLSQAARSAHRERRRRQDGPARARLREQRRRRRSLRHARAGRHRACADPRPLRRVCQGLEAALLGRSGRRGYRHVVRWRCALRPY